MTTKQPARPRIALLAAAMVVAGLAQSRALAAAPAPQSLQPAQGQRPATRLHPLFTGVPGAADAPAPEWVRPGARITLYSASAATNSSAGGSSLVSDPGGKWVDSAGNRYSESSVGLGSAGAGYTQIDVVSMSDGVVVLDLRFFLITNHGEGPTKLAFYWSDVVHPSGCEWWVNPELLKRYVGTRAGGVTVQRVSYDLNGRLYPAIYIHTLMGSGYTSYAYDENTGILLGHTSSATSARDDLMFNQDDWNSGTVTSGGSGKNIVVHRFVGSRTVNVPWAGQQPPRWVREIDEFQYEGHLTTHAPSMLRPLQMKAGSTLRIKRRGSDWIEADQTISIQGPYPNIPPQTATLVRVSGANQIGGLWISPSALSNLRPGQVIDSDPITGGRVVVTRVGRDARGRSVVVLTETAQIDRHSFVYDARSGMLVGLSKTDTYARTRTNMTTEVSLTSYR